MSNTFTKFSWIWQKEIINIWLFKMFVATKKSYLFSGSLRISLRGNRIYWCSCCMASSGIPSNNFCSIWTFGRVGSLTRQTQMGFRISNALCVCGFLCCGFASAIISWEGNKIWIHLWKRHRYVVKNEWYWMNKKKGFKVKRDNNQRSFCQLLPQATTTTKKQKKKQRKRNIKPKILKKDNPKHISMFARKISNINKYGVV